MVVGDLAHDLHALSEGEYLGALACAESAYQRFGFAFSLLEPVAGAHAERVVDGHDGDFAGTLQGGDPALDIGVSECKNDQKNQSRAESKQHQVAQAAVLDRTLRALLEE